MAAALTAAALFFLFLAPARTNCDLDETLVDAWDLLSWKNVSIYSSLADCIKSLPLVLKRAARKDIMVVWRHLHELDEVGDYDGTPGGLPEVQHATTIVFSKWGDPSYNYSDAIINTLRMQRHDTVLVATTDMASAREFWKITNHTLGFFAIDLSRRPDNGLRLSRMVVHKAVEGDNLREAAFYTRGGKEKALSSGMGVTLRVGMLPYEPQMTFACGGVGECEEEVAVGSAVDMLVAIAQRSNLTLDMELEPSGAWGSVPPQANGTVANFTGILRSLLAGRYDVLSSLWTHSVVRSRWFAYAPAAKHHPLRCFADARRISMKTDVLFLLRPFSSEVWVACLVAFGTLGCTHVLCVANRFHSEIPAGVSGLVFAILSTFYSGALVMVLVTEDSLPFDTVREGLADGQWKSLVEDGLQYVFRNNFDLSDPVFREAHERALRQEPMTKRQLLEALTAGEENVFLYGNSHRIAAKAREMQVEGRPVDIVEFCRPTYYYNALIAAKSSPFRKVLHDGMIKLLQSGTMSQIERTWYADLPRKSERPDHSFGVSHVSLACAAYLLGLCGVFVLLVIERQRVARGCPVSNELSLASRQ